MCLIALAYDVHPSYKLILAANRDEFYERPSSAADFWKHHPRVLAGRDLQSGGTWLGVTKDGRFAAVTNYRDPSSFKSNALSRGKLVSEYLTGRQPMDRYLHSLSSCAGQYNDFNLLLGDGHDVFVYSSRGKTQKLRPGIYGLSNHLLDSPWPKVTRSKRLLKAALAKKGDALEEDLFSMLSDRRTPPDDKLPSTGIGLEWERFLSSVFIKSPVYGTRSSTVVMIGRNRRLRFVEKIFDGQEESWMVTRFSFVLEN